MILNKEEYKKQLGRDIENLIDLQNKASQYTVNNFYLRCEKDGDVYLYEMRRLQKSESTQPLPSINIKAETISISIESSSREKFSLLGYNQYKEYKPGKEITKLRQLITEAKKFREEPFYLKYEKGGEEYLYGMIRLTNQQCEQLELFNKLEYLRLNK